MRNKNQGMTLIEVLVAFILLSVTMAVILQIFSGGMRNARRSEGYSRAVFLAESQLAAAGVEQAIAPGEASGQVGNDLAWRVVVEPYDTGDSAEQPLVPLRLYQVRVRVSWSAENREHLVELSTLRLGAKQ